MSRSEGNDIDTAAASGRRRSNPRHTLLLEVTCELIGRKGLDAVSHRRVAELAGVPLGSTTYYFASRDDLLVQALEYFAREEIDGVRQRLGDLDSISPSGEDLVQEFVEFVMPQLGDLRWRTIAQYTLFTEAARRHELEAIAHEWNQAWCSLLETLFKRLGAREPWLDARMFLGMFDGLMLNQVAAPEPDFENAVLRPALARWFERAAGS